MVEIIPIDKQIPDLKRSISCIGYFDAMHKGHQALIKETVKIAEEKDLCAQMICFSPDPDEVIFKKENTHLFSDEDRFSIAESFGIQRIILIHFDETFMNLEPLEFIHQYLNQMNIEELVCGYDFSYGRYGKGDPELLKKEGNFSLRLIPEEQYNSRKISSTWIKETIKSGDFRLSEQLLGFTYYFTVEVLKTVPAQEKWLLVCKNKDAKLMVPEDGEYKGLFTIKDGLFYIQSDEPMEEGKELKVFAKYE